MKSISISNRHRNHQRSVLVETLSAQHAARAAHKSGRKACQEPKTGPGRLSQKVRGKTVQSDFLRERESNIHRHGQLYRGETCNGTAGRKRQQPTNRTANGYVQSRHRPPPPWTAPTTVYHCRPLPYPQTPPYGVLWVARYDGQARKLSNTKSSSVVPAAPFSPEKDVQQSVDAFIQVLGCSCLG